MLEIVAIISVIEKTIELSLPSNVSTTSNGNNIKRSMDYLIDDTSKTSLEGIYPQHHGKDRVCQLPFVNYIISNLLRLKTRKTE